MTVCEFARQVRALNGRTVRVRGVLTLFETDPEGATPDHLIATCSDMKPGMVTVKIDYPDMWFLKKPPKGYHVDTRSFLRAHRVIMSTLKGGRVEDRYRATIVGQAYLPPPESDSPPSTHITREGSYAGGIVIEGIYDVKIFVN